MNNVAASLKKLDIEDAEDQIVNTVWNNQVTIVTGDPGSGKTTQIPIFLHRAGFTEKGRIAIAQPRRITAVSVATYVSQLLNSQLGEIVSYKIRFSNWTTQKTEIKYLTEGMLLVEMIEDPLLTQYVIVVVDEAHERSAICDVLLLMLHHYILPQRPDLRVIVTSATMDDCRFSEYFGNAPIIRINGKSFDVQIHYADKTISQREIVPVTIGKVREIHSQRSTVDVLAFVPGSQEIYEICNSLNAQYGGDLAVFPLAGWLSYAEQQKIFADYPGKQKVIVATNIAETGITIDSRLEVVDSGYVKMNFFNARTGVEELRVVQCSQAECTQRAGRAGRTHEGVCHRLYTEESFLARPLYGKPEIKRTSLSDIILRLERHGLSAINDLPFLDAPDTQHFYDAYQTLFAIGALNRDEEGLPAGLTSIGVRMSRFPVKAEYARMLVDAEKFGCLKEIITIAAFLSNSGKIFEVLPGYEDNARTAHRSLKNATSDAIMFLVLWDAYEKSGFDYQWCKSNYLNPSAFDEVAKIREQFLEIARDLEMRISTSDDQRLVMRAFSAGLIRNLFKKNERNSYDGVFRKDCVNLQIHPSSGMFEFQKESVQYIIATDIVRTSRLWARVCSAVPMEWLAELAPDRFERGEVMLTEWNAIRNCARGYIPILEDGEVIAQHMIEVSHSEALEIQRVADEEAQAQGLVKLTFRKSTSKAGGYVAPYVGNSLIRIRSIEEGTYYCKVEDTRFTVIATPVSRVVDIPATIAKVTRSLIRPLPPEGKKRKGR